jgi:hypothetical protein
MEVFHVTLNEIPAQAGIQYSADSIVYWIPAFAGISYIGFRLR